MAGLLLLSCAGWVEVGVVPHMSAAKPGTSMLLLHERPGGRPGLWRTYSWASRGQASPENCGAWDSYIEIFCGRNRAAACDGTESRRSVAGGSRHFLAGSRDCDIGSRSLCQLSDRTCEVCCFNSFFAHMMSMCWLWNTKRRVSWLSSFRKLHSRPGAGYRQCQAFVM